MVVNGGTEEATVDNCVVLHTWTKGMDTDHSDSTKKAISLNVSGW